MVGEFCFFTKKQDAKVSFDLRNLVLVKLFSMSGCWGYFSSPFGTRTTSRSAASNAQVTLTAQGGKPRVNVVWHKMSDLRLHDHEALARAHLETPRTLTSWEKIDDPRESCLGDVVAIVCFSFCWYLLKCSGLPVVHLHVVEKFWFGKTRVGGFPKTGAVRCRFWMECVEDLKNALEARGQQLFVRHGNSAWLWKCRFELKVWMINILLIGWERGERCLIMMNPI